jgi:hypothetical protein
MENNELATVAFQNGLEKSKVEILLTNFAGYFAEAKEIVATARTIKVTDATQKAQMELARQARLELRTLRGRVEETRVKLKEQSLREGRAIDGVSNLIKALVIPVEEELEKQEKFVQMKEEARVRKMYEDLAPFVDNINVFNLKDMSDEAFANLLKEAIVAKNLRIEADKKADEDRITKEKLAQEEREKLRLENEALAKKNAEAERILAEERKKQADALAEKKRQIDELELNAKKEKEAQEAKIKAEADEKRKLALAPDKDKLVKFAEVIAMIELPEVTSTDANTILVEAKTTLEAISEFLIYKSKLL